MVNKTFKVFNIRIMQIKTVLKIYLTLVRVSVSEQTVSLLLEVETEVATMDMCVALSQKTENRITT